MEKVYLRKLEDLELEYEKKQRTIEESIEEALYDKRQFNRELENLSENYRYHYQQANFSEPIAMRTVYHLLEQCQGEGNRVVTQTVRDWEDEKEENRISYRKETQSIEDELTLFKEKERGQEHE